MRQSPREWGWPLEVFFPGTPNKIGELLKLIAVLLSKLSVVLLLLGVLKQKLLFSSMIFYLRSADWFFFTACTIVYLTRLSSAHE